MGEPDNEAANYPEQVEPASPKHSESSRQQALSAGATNRTQVTKRLDFVRHEFVFVFGLFVTFCLPRLNVFMSCFRVSVANKRYCPLSTVQCRAKLGTCGHLSQFKVKLADYFLHPPL